MYISDDGHECDEWFPHEEDDVPRKEFCPKYHRSLMTTQKHIDLINSQKHICYDMTNEQLEDHIKSIEAELAGAMEMLKTKLSAARAVRAERFEKMTEEERKELRKYQVKSASNSNGSKPRSKSVKVDSATKLANRTAKLGISRDDLLSMDMDDLIKKFKKAKGE
jgi:hypothetical protein